MSEHAPTPWTIDEVRTDSGRAFRIGSGEMLKVGKGCCIIYDDYPGAPDNERKANAAFIIQACNAHDDLVGALRFILAFYEPGQRTLDTEAWKRAEAAGRAALAKAEGKQP